MSRSLSAALVLLSACLAPGVRAQPGPLSPDPAPGTIEPRGEARPGPRTEQPAAPDGAAPAAVPGQTAPAPPSSAVALESTWDNGLIFLSPNKDWKIHVGGRLQFEPIFWRQANELKGSPPGNGGIPTATATDGNGVGVLDDGMFFRRVRLRSDGVGYGTVEYAFEVDFEQLNYVTYDHMWAGFKDLPVLGTVRVGQHKVPQGLEMMGSDYHLTLLERSSLADAFWTLFAPGIFVANTYLDQHVTTQAMFHRVQPVGFYTSDFGDGNYAFTGRATATPVYADEGAHVLHVGASYQWRSADLGRTIQPGGTGNDVGDARKAVRFRARPELRDATGIGTGVLGGDTGRFVDTGFLLANSVTTVRPELLWILGPFSLQAEAAFATVSQAQALYPAADRGSFLASPTLWGGAGTCRRAIS